MPKKPAIKSKDVDQATSHARNVLAQVLGLTDTTKPKLRVVKRTKAKRK